MRLKGFEPQATEVVKPGKQKMHNYVHFSPLLLNMAGTEGEVANTSTPVFAITDKTLQAVEKLVDSLEKLGIKYVDGKLVYDEEEAGYEYLQ